MEQETGIRSLYDEFLPGYGAETRLFCPACRPNSTYKPSCATRRQNACGVAEAPMTAVRYFVSDVDRSVDFYTTHLGFALARRVGVASAVVVRGDVTLWLTHVDPLYDAKPGGWNRLILE